MQFFFYSKGILSFCLNRQNLRRVCVHFRFVQFVSNFFCVTTGNIHVYTNRGAGASYSHFYQPRRRRAYERREEEVQENRSQVSHIPYLSLISLLTDPCALLIIIFPNPVLRSPEQSALLLSKLLTHLYPEFELY